MWLYYWLAANGINPMTDAKMITVPPPQMVANMRVGNMDGYCVGEPWGHRAIADGIGITAITTQDIWKDHPEKVARHDRRVRAEKSEHCAGDDRRHHRRGKMDRRVAVEPLKMAETVADKSYVNTSVEVINQRILGRYQNGLGKTWDDPNHMKFYNDGAVTFPYLSDGMWFLTQHRRWGLLKTDVDYSRGRKAGQSDRTLQRGGDAEQSAACQRSDAYQRLVDGVVWDGKQPAQYAANFKIRALA